MGKTNGKAQENLRTHSRKHNKRRGKPMKNNLTIRRFSMDSIGSPSFFISPRPDKTSKRMQQTHRDLVQQRLWWCWRSSKLISMESWFSGLHLESCFLHNPAAKRNWQTAHWMSLVQQHCTLYHVLMHVPGSRYVCFLFPRDPQQSPTWGKNEPSRNVSATIIIVIMLMKLIVILLLMKTLRRWL